MNLIDIQNKIDDILEKLHIDKLLQKMRVFRRKKAFKISCAIMAVVLVAAYIGFLIVHNGEYLYVTYELHDMNERVCLGDNYVEIYPSDENSVFSSGYYVTFTNAEMVDLEEYVAENFDNEPSLVFGSDVSDSDTDEEGSLTLRTADDVINFYSNGTDTSNKLIIIDVLLENVSAEGERNDGIPIVDFKLSGVDWYATGDYILSGLFNKDTLEYTASAYTANGTSTTFKLMFELTNKYIDYDKMDEEEMYVYITVSPVVVGIKVEL